ncbi:HD-GYP domain-containing protein [Salisediminibacterium selenitireducens]|uniref:Metal dependent phosphohydrolase n=1 Tax=Bacillus selenitireducens (strain ATCC 700615 / DSM 15326 / MLS10) TaxID=439292 RepID=D6Y0X1_BACIE|nr:HD-GYP domain-containing protein [Salisediminibacterium selenitireducens]ADH98575.1 metal dependent phosphohydrolase [[Bacillus] selenitireducens MLS10]
MDTINLQQYAHLALDRKLARDVLSDSGFTLLREGMVITPNHIRLLKSYDIESIPVYGHTSFLEQLDAKVKEQHKPFVSAYRDSFNRMKTLFANTDESGVPDLDQTLDSFETLVTESLKSYSLFEVLQQLEGHDGYLLRHSIHVGLLVSLMAKLMKKPDDEIVEYGKAGLLHDIGMTRMPDSVFHKSGTLTEDEWAQVREHPQIGYDLLKDKGVSQLVLDATLYHHERMDGSGYLKGLKGDEIPEVAAMIALADVFDAVSSDRVHRSKMAPMEALKTINDDIYRGKLSIRCGLAFIQHMTSTYTGTTVYLSDGRFAQIVRYQASDLENPMISLEGKVVQLKDLKGVSIIDIADNRVHEMQKES